MSKISLIIQREYMTRVKKKSFIIMSVVAPLLFACMFVLPAWFSSMEDTNTKRIAVIDYSHKYTQALESTEFLKFEPITELTESELQKEFKSKGYDAYLTITDSVLTNEGAVKIYSDAQITMDTKDHLKRNFRGYLEKEFLASQNISGLDQIIQQLNNIHVDITTIKLGDDGVQKESSAEFTMIISLVFAMMIYMFVLVYGTQVMRGVMEEKTNRIVEVIVSSVKPFELMMGKIVGIAMVALTQFLLWVVLTAAIVSTIQAVAPTKDRPSITAQQEIVMDQMNPQQLQKVDEDVTSGFFTEFNKIMSKIDFGMIIWSLISFLFFFLGGYLLYASLFAAVGSALDVDTDSQQFVMPIMMPLILSIYIALAAFRNPGSDLAFWFSMIPLTSPVVMMARIPFDIPTWEILLSMFILTLSFIGMTYVAGRIYRTGILMYGKKVTYKEMWRWFKESGK